MKFSHFCAGLLVGVFWSIYVANCYEVESLQNLCTTKLSRLLNMILSREKPQIGRGSAAIIHQTWNRSRTEHFHCKFSVQAQDKRPGSGFYIVLTKLKFRTNPNTNSCVDWIEIYKGGTPNTPRRRICGEIDVEQPNSQDVFDDREKEAKFEVFIDNRFTIVEPLELKMVITSHSACMGSPDEFQCDPDDVNSCISQELVNDGIANCLPPCRDEKSCYHQKTITAEAIDPSSFALSALASLIFTMFGVGAIVWFAWTYWNWRVSVPTRENRSRGEEIPQTIELPHSSYQSTTRISHSPSAPLDKDMPPSYESLFPDR